MVTSFYPFVSVTPKSNSTDPFPEKHSLSGWSWYQIRSSHTKERSMNMSTVEFPVEFEKKPEQDLDLVVHVFDPAGKFLKSAKVKDGKASLPLEALQV